MPTQPQSLVPPFLELARRLVSVSGRPDRVEDVGVLPLSYYCIVPKKLSDVTRFGRVYFDHDRSVKYW